VKASSTTLSNPLDIAGWNSLRNRKIPESYSLPTEKASLPEGVNIGKEAEGRITKRDYSDARTLPPDYPAEGKTPGPKFGSKTVTPKKKETTSATKSENKTLKPQGEGKPEDSNSDLAGSRSATANDNNGRLPTHKSDVVGLQKESRLGKKPAANDNALEDVSSRFHFRSRWTEGSFQYEQASMRLGVPGKVLRHDSSADRKTMSEGTGEHASHRVGEQYGALGDKRNMSLFNANINTYTKSSERETLGKGGSYAAMEAGWTRKLKAGYQIDVTVTDQYKPGTDRPISREVKWTEIAPGGKSVQKSETFGNFSSPQKRYADQLKLAPPPPPQAGR
jgi:hypothetical protein